MNLLGLFLILPMIIIFALCRELLKIVLAALVAGAVVGAFLMGLVLLIGG